MKYLKLYDKESAYITDLGNNELYVPNVAFCKDTNNVHYFSPAHESTALCSTSLRDGKIVKVKQMVDMSSQWDKTRVSVSYAGDNELNCTCTEYVDARAWLYRVQMAILTNHVYFCSANVYSDIVTAVTLGRWNSSGIQNISTSKWNKVVGMAYTGSSEYFYLGMLMTAVGDVVKWKEVQVLDLTSMGLSTEAEFRSYLGLSDSDDIPYFEYGENEYIALSGKLYKLTDTWMIDAAMTYGIPYDNILKAYAIDSDIKKSFDGTGRYLVFTGSQYFDTGYKSTEIDHVEFDVIFSSLPEYGSDMHVVCNSRSAESQNYRTYGAPRNVDGVTKWEMCYNSTQLFNLGTEITTLTKYHVESTIRNGYQKLMVDGTVLNEDSASMQSTSVENYIGAWNGNGDIAATLKGKLNNILLSCQTIVKRFYVPIKQADGTCTMIDLMTMTYPTKVGTFTIE